MPEPKTSRQARGHKVAEVYENGEIYDTRPEPTRRRRRTGKGEVMYVMLEMEAAQKAPKSLNQTEQRVLALVLSDYNPPEQAWARMTATEMALALNLDRNFLYKTIRDLRARRFLFKISSTAWYVNPHYGFRGSKADWAEALESTEAPAW
jgi:hypothetical protein